jgi:deoxyribodipyrimidine photo-lyase
MSQSSTLVWFRHDLRLSDNPALSAAVARGGPIIPVYIWSPEEEGNWPPGAASRWWLEQSLRKLADALASRGSRLVVRQGPAARTLLDVARETGADAVVWNRRYEPAAVECESHVKVWLREFGVSAQSFNGSLLFEPSTIRNTSGEPFRVFTPFFKACMKQKLAPESPAAPRRLPAPDFWPCSIPLPDLRLEPRADRAAGLRAAWEPGEEGARKQLRRFEFSALTAYPLERDRPDHLGTSRLSPYLHFGEVSPGEVWRAVVKTAGYNMRECEAYLRQLVWREFAYHLLFHFPHTADRPLRPEFDRFPWISQRKRLDAWKLGETGYALVDAGMREVWQTGWMHNRVRMVAASFLVKHLLIPWQEGAKWFWDTLVDADLANNTLGWQWTAGCGADAAPFFRIFNPALQAKKFDPDALYVRRWVPEAGSDLYPEPIVHHHEARLEALLAWHRLGRESAAAD